MVVEVEEVSWEEVAAEPRTREVAAGMVASTKEVGAEEAPKQCADAAGIPHRRVDRPHRRR